MSLMTRAFKEAWLKALTDGSYRRQTSELVAANDGCIVDEGYGSNPPPPVDHDHYRCCLGVAHAIAQQMGLIPADRSIYDDEYRTSEILFDSEAEAIGLTIDDQRQFAQLNDEGVVKEGRYYPDEVVEKVGNWPTAEDTAPQG